MSWPRPRIHSTSFNRIQKKPCVETCRINCWIVRGMNRDKRRSILGKIVLPWDCPALCSRTFHGNPREEAQRDAAGLQTWRFVFSEIRCEMQQVTTYQYMLRVLFSFLQCQNRNCDLLSCLICFAMPRLEMVLRCEAHQQDGRDQWFAAAVLQELSFCRRCRSHPHKDPAKVR